MCFIIALLWGSHFHTTKLDAYWLHRSHRYSSNYTCLVGYRSFLNHHGQYKVKKCSCLECGEKCNWRSLVMPLVTEVSKVRQMSTSYTLHLHLHIIHLFIWLCSHYYLAHWQANYLMHYRFDIWHAQGWIWWRGSWSTSQQKNVPSTWSLGASSMNVFVPFYILIHMPFPQR